jgi:serine O-acetyltransferase
MLKTGVQIPGATKIDRGFRIVHFGNIVINPATVIDKYFYISNGVAISSSEGRLRGVPIIGNNVSLQTNAIVVSGIRIGDDMLIAPNSVVNIDIPCGAITIGNPCIIIKKEKASSNYIVNKVE